MAVPGTQPPRSYDGPNRSEVSRWREATFAAVGMNSNCQAFIDGCVELRLSGALAASTPAAASQSTLNWQFTRYRQIAGQRQAGRAGRNQLQSLTPFPEPNIRSTVPYGVVQADGTFAIRHLCRRRRRSDRQICGDGLMAGRSRSREGKKFSVQDRLKKAFDDPQRPVAEFAVQEGPNSVPTIDLKAR